MNYVIGLLRLLHIVAAFFWFGIGMFTYLYVGPAAQKAGASGLRFLKVILTQTALPKVVASAGGTTTLMGILLYLTNPSQRFSTLGFIVLSIGALAGIGAMIHGAAVTSKVSDELVKAITDNVPEGDGPIPADKQSLLDAVSAKMNTVSSHSFILMMIALIGMASARYL